MNEPQPAPTQQYVYNARITNVVDGDTVDAVVDLGFHASVTMRLRLADVNSPEVHGPTRDAGLAAAAFTRSTLGGKDVLIRTRKADDFGRYLARVWTGGGVDFNALLVESGFAVPYRTGQSGA
jgi:micrococcal nuclease